jgi:hypothetical protein
VTDQPCDKRTHNRMKRMDAPGPPKKRRHQRPSRSASPEKHTPPMKYLVQNQQNQKAPAAICFCNATTNAEINAILRLQKFRAKSRTGH